MQERTYIPPYKKNAPRIPATVARANRYGLANQITYEAEGKAKRTALRARLDAGKTAARTNTTKKRKPSTGMDAGTLGGSWLSAFKR